MFDDLKKQTKEITMFQMPCHCKSKSSRGNYSLYHVKQTGSELKKLIFCAKGKRLIFFQMKCAPHLSLFRVAPFTVPSSHPQNRLPVNYIWLGLRCSEITHGSYGGSHSVRSRWASWSWKALGQLSAHAHLHFKTIGQNHQLYTGLYFPQFPFTTTSEYLSNKGFQWTLK